MLNSSVNDVVDSPREPMNHGTASHEGLKEDVFDSSHITSLLEYLSVCNSEGKFKKENGHSVQADLISNHHPSLPV